MTCLTAACVFDIRYRRIPNIFVVWSLVNAGFLQLFTTGSIAGLMSSFAAFLIALPFFLLHAAGAGDVKIYMIISVFLKFRTILLFGMISLIVTVIYGLAIRLLYRKKGLTRVPMAPGFLVGAGILYLNGGIL